MSGVTIQVHQAHQQVLIAQYTAYLCTSVSQVLLDIRSRWLGGSSTGAGNSAGAIAVSSNIPSVHSSAQEPAAVAAPTPRAVFRVKWTRLPSDGVRAGQPEGRRQSDRSGPANAALTAHGGAQQQQQQQQRVWGVLQQWRQSRSG